jgi:hypothetical protein
MVACRRCCNFLQFDTHRGAELRVQVGERFIKEEQLRFPHDGPPHRDALPLASGQVFGFAVQERLDVQQLRGFGDAGFNPVAGDAAHLQRKGEVLANGEVRVECVLLKHHGDVAFGRRQ